MLTTGSIRRPAPKRLFAFVTSGQQMVPEVGCRKRLLRAEPWAMATHACCPAGISTLLCWRFGSDPACMRRSPRACRNHLLVNRARCTSSASPRIVPESRSCSCAPRSVARPEPSQMRPVPGVALVSSAWELLSEVRMLRESGKAHGAAIGVYVVVCVVLVIIAG